MLCRWIVNKLSMYSIHLVFLLERWFIKRNYTYVSTFNGLIYVVNLAFQMIWFVRRPLLTLTKHDFSIQVYYAAVFEDFFFKTLVMIINADHLVPIVVYILFLYCQLNRSICLIGQCTISLYVFILHFLYIFVF